MAENIFEDVTRVIVADLKKGVVPWVRPWKSGTSTGGLPVNRQTGKAYRGVNVPLLWRSVHHQGFGSDTWMTFRQAQRLGGHVSQGSKGTRIILWKAIDIDDDTEQRTVPVVRIFTVFNAEQVEGLPESIHTEPEWNSEKRAEAMLRLAEIGYGGTEAFYAPDPDIIRLPRRTAFADAAGFYSTALHELVHWSGHEDRLARSIHHPWGTPDYAREELVAEMGAAFLTSLIGIGGNLQHPEYIGDWLKVLRADSRAIFRAASAAQKAVDYLQQRVDAHADTLSREAA